MRYLCEAFELDSYSRELRRDGQTMTIAPRLLKILLYLIEHRDRPVPSHELLDALWGPEVHIEAGAVAQSIRHLRRLLGDDGKQQRVIKTFTGHGYRFVAPLECDSGERPPLEPSWLQLIHYPRNSSPDTPSEVESVIESSDRMVTIGRAPWSCVYIEDPMVSWEHGLIILMRGNYVYRHLGSTPSMVTQRGQSYTLTTDTLTERILSIEDRLDICPQKGEDGRVISVRTYKSDSN